MTHINAYFADVDEAYAKVEAAHGAWEAAKLRLETKKKEVGYVEPAAPAKETAAKEEQDPSVTTEAPKKK